MLDDETPFDLAELIQLACMGVHSVRLEISVHGTHVGEVQVHEGELWSVRDARGRGADALERLLFVEHAHIEASVLEPAQIAKRSITVPTQQALMDAARAHDERRRLEPPVVRRKDSMFPDPLPDPLHEPFPVRESGVLPSDFRAATLEHFEQLRGRAAEALLDRRLDEAYQLLVEAAELETHPWVEANLERLRELGFPRG